MAATLEQLAAQSLAGDRHALNSLMRSIKDDVYRLAKRMLGSPTEAEDATQEILIRVLTHLASFRGESSLRTWVWRIASRHLLRLKRGGFESATDFALIEKMIDEGATAEPVPVDAADAAAIADEVRLGCTQAMLTALDREDRVAFILADIFELSSTEAADILELEAATYRKRLQRARARLAEFMRGRCGIVDPLGACRCLRQVPVLTRRGLLDIQTRRPRDPVVPRPLDRAHSEMTEVERVARAIRESPESNAPDRILNGIRALINDQRIRLFDA